MEEATGAPSSFAVCNPKRLRDRLDVMVLPEEECSSVSNDAAGWAKLVEQLRGSSIAAIGLEASGGYERGVMRALLAAGPSGDMGGSLDRARSKTAVND
jgi:hypothetical protein